MLDSDSSTPTILRLAFASLVVGACGPGANGSGDTAAEPVSLDALPDRAADAYCSVLFRCCDSREASAIDGGSEEACLDSYSGFIQGFVLPDLRASVREGRADYDSEAMGECLAEGKSRDCSAFPGGDGAGAVGACETAFRPQIEEGGTCIQDLDCKSGVCLKESANADRGTCTVLAGEGESCENVGCRDELWCDSTTQKCEKPRAEGESCPAGSACRSRVCEQNQMGDGVCRPKRSGGDSCVTNAVCVSGVCEGAAGGSEGTCLPTPICDGG